MSYHIYIMCLWPDFRGEVKVTELELSENAAKPSTAVQDCVSTSVSLIAPDIFKVIGTISCHVGRHKNMCFFILKMFLLTKLGTLHHNVIYSER